MSESILRIEKLENGYEVEICDPKIMEENQKPKSAWKDPWKGYIFASATEAAQFVAEHLDSLKPPPDAEEEFQTEFQRQANKEE